jgi:hypothetical protein
VNRENHYADQENQPGGTVLANISTGSLRRLASAFTTKTLGILSNRGEVSCVLLWRSPLDSLSSPRTLVSRSQERNAPQR